MLRLVKRYLVVGIAAVCFASSSDAGIVVESVRAHASAGDSDGITFAHATWDSFNDPVHASLLASYPEVEGTTILNAVFTESTVWAELETTHLIREQPSSTDMWFYTRGGTGVTFVADESTLVSVFARIDHNIVAGLGVSGAELIIRVQGGNRFISEQRWILEPSVPGTQTENFEVLLSPGEYDIFIGDALWTEQSHPARGDLTIASDILLTIAIVPEPGTAIFLVAGFAALVSRRRKAA